MAGHIRATLGPVSLVGEWNGAVSQARFITDTGALVKMQPGAWQVTMGYQFDWNPWVESIGLQGDYIAIGYSESNDLVGVPFGGVRVGSVPRRRFLVSLGEWIFDSLRLAIEYSYIMDYERGEGGTGATGNGFLSTLTYVW
jgi:hypothetical protein